MNWPLPQTTETLQDAVLFGGVLYAATQTHLYTLTGPTSEALFAVGPLPVRKVTAATATDVTPTGCTGVLAIRVDGALLWLVGKIATGYAVWTLSGSTWTRRAITTLDLSSATGVFVKDGIAYIIGNGWWIVRGSAVRASRGLWEVPASVQTEANPPLPAPPTGFLSVAVTPLVQGATCTVLQPTFDATNPPSDGEPVTFTWQPTVRGSGIATTQARLFPTTAHGLEYHLVGVGTEWVYTVGPSGGYASGVTVGRRETARYVYLSVPSGMVYLVGLEWADDTATHGTPTATTVGLEWDTPDTPTIEAVGLEWADDAATHDTPAVTKVGLEWDDGIGYPTHTPTITLIGLEWDSDIYEGPVVSSVGLEWESDDSPQASEGPRFYVIPGVKAAKWIRFLMQADDLTLYRVLYRFDAEDVDPLDWTSYTPLPIGADVAILNPGTVARIAIIKPNTAPVPLGNWLLGV